MKKKNITVSVDEETYRAARIWAACNNTSVSAVVRDLLKRLRGARRTPPAKPATPAKPAAPPSPPFPVKL